MPGILILMIFFATSAIFTDVSGQMMPGTINSNNQRRLDVHAYVFAAPSEQPPSHQPTNVNTRLNYNLPGNSGHRPEEKQPRQRNLVDYPFTVEYVDRRNPSSRTGTGSKSQHDDENLIDYPFTIEYVNNMNNNPAENLENRGQASLLPNQDKFQSTAQHQPYQQNNPHHHSSGGHHHKSGGGGGGR